MTPMTIARPTIVGTRPPDVVPAFSVALALVSERLSGVDSPSAANVAGARRSRPSTAPPADLKAGEICITEEGRVWIRTRPLHRPRFVHLECRYPVYVLPGARSRPTIASASRSARSSVDVAAALDE